MNMNKITSHKKNIVYVFVAMFFFSLTVALTGYINSNFLELQGWSNTVISSVYIISSLLTLVILPLVPRITNRIGNNNLMISLLAASIVSIAGVVFGVSPIIQIISLSLFVF